MPEDIRLQPCNDCVEALVDYDRVTIFDAANQLAEGSKANLEAYECLLALIQRINNLKCAVEKPCPRLVAFHGAMQECNCYDIEEPSP